LVGILLLQLRDTPSGCGRLAKSIRSGTKNHADRVILQEALNIARNKLPCSFARMPSGGGPRRMPMRISRIENRCRLNPNVDSGQYKGYHSHHTIPPKRTEPTRAVRWFSPCRVVPPSADEGLLGRSGWRLSPWQGRHRLSACFGLPLGNPNRFAATSRDVGKRHGRSAGIRGRCFPAHRGCFRPAAGTGE